MRHAWEEVRLLYDGERLGAESWMQIVARRSGWLYGRAHSPSGMFRQRTDETTTSDAALWEGTTRYRAEHPTLNFCARINLAVGGAAGARLQYCSAAGYWTGDVWTAPAWTTIESDANTGDRWFGGAENRSYDLAALGTADSLPDDGCLRLRLMVDGTGGPSTANVYRAFLSGTAGFTGWAAMADFASGGVPTAAQLNAIRQSQTHLLECAERVNVSQACDTYQHTQDDAEETVCRYSFRHDGRMRLYLYLYTSRFNLASEQVNVYLCDEKYPSAGARLNGGAAILALTGAGGDVNQGYNFDLATYGLTLGSYYQVEIRTRKAAGDEAPILGIGAASILDTGSPTRSHVPGTFAHGDVLTHTDLNTIADDLEQMYSGTAGAESPIYSEHWVSTHQHLGYGMLNLIASRVRLHHTWRWLWYGSTGPVPLYLRQDGSQAQATLPGTDGEPTLYDLENVSGLAEGQEYYISDNGDNRVLFAFEDYES